MQKDLAMCFPFRFGAFALNFRVNFLHRFRLAFLDDSPGHVQFRDEPLFSRSQLFQRQVTADGKPRSFVDVSRMECASDDNFLRRGVQKG
mgnify:CR=1 FL=1